MYRSKHYGLGPLLVVSYNPLLSKYVPVTGSAQDFIFTVLGSTVHIHILGLQTPPKYVNTNFWGFAMAPHKKI